MGELDCEELLSSFVQDMWSPFPVTPEALEGLEDACLMVECQSPVTEGLFGDSGLTALQKAAAEILRAVGLETDPSMMSGIPAVPGLMLMVNLDEEGDAVRLYVAGIFVALSPDQEGTGIENAPRVGFCKCLEFPLPITKGPELSTTCVVLALPLIHAFADTLLEQNPHRHDHRR